MRRAVVLLLAIAIATLPVAAAAQATDAAADLYRQHMDVGISFYEQRNYAAAIAEFEEAYKARPKASPLVNLALCYKAQFAYTKAIRALAMRRDARWPTGVYRTPTLIGVHVVVLRELPRTTDTLPLLLFACSQQCVKDVPEAPDVYLPEPHTGGRGSQRPRGDGYR